MSNTSIRIMETVALAAIAMLAVSPSESAQSNLQLADLSLEELGFVEVTSVSKRSEQLLDAPASVFVITREDIVRAGVASIPEALRLAPGVEVARRSSHAWSISIRGFNSDLANKLLVLIDGRSVYSPLYAGVFWDVQDTLLQDIDRIEVVSGPGGTLWGANAVNGVINIITRSATETRGRYLEVGGGLEERGFAGFRFGRDVGSDAAIRAYFKYFDRDASKRAGGGDAIDAWRMGRGGFRMDWRPSESDHIRLQGDIYSGEKDGEFLDSFTLGTLPAGLVTADTEMSGGNLMAKWRRELAPDADFELQFYYDRTARNIPHTYNETRDTLDLGFQHHFKAGNRHDLLWGAGFRLTSDDIGNTIFATFDTNHRSDQTVGLFLQDKIDIWRERMYLTLGSKFEHNDYTGFEWQPNARMSWLIDDRQTLWFAVSRAVRIPSRLDADLHLTAPLSIPGIPFPVYFTIDGSRDFESEELVAYEAGYRIQASEKLYVDLATYYNDYDRLQTSEPQAPVFVLPSYIILPNVLSNNMKGHASGGTVVLNWQATADWRLRFHYAIFYLRLRTGSASEDTAATNIAGNSPKHQVSVFSDFDLLERFNLHTAVRYVNELPNQGVDAYTAIDMSFRWNLSDNVTVSLTGQNLNDAGHPEFSPVVIETERAAYLKVSWLL